MRCMIDIEGDGLLPTATKMHCLVGKDIDTGEVFKAYPGMPGSDSIAWDKLALIYLDNCDTIMAHNGIGFDIPFLKKIYDWEPMPEQEIIDTLVMSRHLNPDRPRVEGTNKGPHSVEAWGLRLGRWKPEYDDWTRFTMEMLHRCTEDVEIQHLIYLELLKECTITDVSKSIFDPKAYRQHDWSKSMYKEHRSAQIMQEQEENGCVFDKEMAVKSISVLDDYVCNLEQEILPFTPTTPKQKGVSVSKPFKKNGDLTKAVYDWLETIELPEYSQYSWSIGGPFTRIQWEGLNLNSDVQVKKWLLEIGWVPTQYNYHKTKTDLDGKPLKTSPKLTPDSFDSLPPDLGTRLKKRTKATHKRSQIQGWVDNVREDGRISAGANPQGTNTGRMRHRLVANIPKANIYENKQDPTDPKNGSLIWFPDPQKTFFGTEMRRMFTCPTDGYLVGRDASGLELRCFAHYIDDPAYTDSILTGDIHSYNQEAAGLETRDQAKTFIYAFLYGAGEEKLGSIVMPNGTKAQKTRAGKELQAQFFAANPKLEPLIKGVRKASRRGWLKGIDGRKVIMRRNKQGRVEEHKALNTLLQSAGAIVMTFARVWLYDEVQKLGGKDFALKVLDYHDEETYETVLDNIESLKELMVRSVVQAGLDLNFNCPLDADAKVGKSWVEIH